jgi:hypothetical protein
LLEYEPDLVLVMHAINDLNVTYRAKAAGVRVDGHYRSKYVTPHFTNGLDEDDVVLFRSLRAAAALLRRPPIVSEPVDGHDLEPGIRYFERNLSSIASLLEATGVRGAFITMPSDPGRVDEHRTAPENAGLVYLPTRDALIADMAAYAATTIRVADSSRGVEAIDMASLFPEDEALFLDIVHFASEGVVRFGEILAHELTDAIPPHDGAFELTEAAVRRCDW